MTARLADRPAVPRATAVLVTGASGGIGRAVARAYAGPGTTLVLHGRDASALEAVGAECLAAGAAVLIWQQDIADTTAVRDWLTRFSSHTPLDIAVVNAAMGSFVTTPAGESWHDIDAVVRTNLLGAMATVDGVLPAMRARGRGQIALVSSLAAWHGVAMMPAYSASKAGLKAYAESLRGWLAAEGIRISLVLPGFVESELARRTPGPKPFMITPDRAARAIVKGLARNRARIAFPAPLAFSNWLLGVLPPDLSRRILAWSGFGVPSASSAPRRV